MLCERHNSALSRLDDVANAFHEAIQELRRLFAGQPAPSVFAFHGFDLERWMLKAMIGFLASGQGGIEHVFDSDSLEVLFGSQNLKAPCGLHFLTHQDTPDFPLFHGLGCDLYFTNGEVSGFRYAFYGFHMLLLTRPLAIKGLHPQDYRPRQLWMKGPAKPFKIDLFWPGAGPRPARVTYLAEGNSALTPIDRLERQHR